MGKRAGIVSGSNDWTKYSYTSRSIEKRTGLTRSEIQQLRREAREEVLEAPSYEQGVTGILIEVVEPPGSKRKGINLRKDNGGTSTERITLFNTPFGVEFDAGGIKAVSGTLDLGVGSIGGTYEFGEDGGLSGSVEAFGFGVEYEPGKGTVSLPGGTEITMVEKGCYVVNVFTLFGQYMYSDIQKKTGL